MLSISPGLGKNAAKSDWAACEEHAVESKIAEITKNFASFIFA
jgi:hypothetical protein